MLKNFLPRWQHRLRHWGGMFVGTSYYHQRQAIGRVFVPGELQGYFNDLTGKTRWTGRCDAEGLPLSQLSNGQVMYFPILLCQKALGHWDLWLLQHQPQDREDFLKIAAWLKGNQDAMGGWDTWGPLGQSRQYSYSAMSQGQAVSTMARAYRLTADPGYEVACRRAIALMQRSLADGGVCYYDADEVVLEEFPGPQKDTVLNGWIFALFGLHDFLLCFADDSIKAFYQRSRASLIQSLPGFDAGFWSYYSSGTRRLASPFYHRLHLSQLEALRQIAEQPGVEATQAVWERYLGNPLYKYWAVLMKGMQKLREPDEITIVG